MARKVCVHLKLLSCNGQAVSCSHFLLADWVCGCRQAVPLTLALLNVSSPSLNAVDTLSRLSHDTDIRVAQNAVLALGE